MEFKLNFLCALKDDADDVVVPWIYMPCYVIRNVYLSFWIIFAIYTVHNDNLHSFVWCPLLPSSLCALRLRRWIVWQRTEIMNRNESHNVCQLKLLLSYCLLFHKCQWIVNSVSKHTHTQRPKNIVKIIYSSMPFWIYICVWVNGAVLRVLCCLGQFQETLCVDLVCIFEVD